MAGLPLNIIRMELCDGTTADEVFETHKMAVLKSRDRFIEICRNALDNERIWVRAPHVLKATWSCPGEDDATQEFSCSCHESKEMSSA